MRVTGSNAPAVLLGLWVVVVAASPLAAQDDIETESITEQGTLDPFSAEQRELQAIFDEAEALFRSFEQPDSVPLFDRLIARLESDHAKEPLPSDLLTMLIQSRSHRAEAHFNLGENERAAEDLVRILELDPGWQIDPDMVSPKLVEVVEQLRSDMVGEILVLVEPLDATVTVGGRPIGLAGQATPVLAGTQLVVIARPGHTPIEEEVEIRAGRRATVEQTLERVSTVVRVRLKPAGATVLVDGEPAQIAERTSIEEAEPEEELAIEGLLPGRHVFEFRLAEYRPYRYGFEAAEIDDYRLPPIALELMRGEVRLADLPELATVSVDGQPSTPARPGDGTASLTLAPGDYLLEVHRPGVGGFQQQVSLGDQEILDVNVRLRPMIAFLGVLGSDRLAASRLATRLQGHLGSMPDWLWSDQSIDAPAVLDSAALTAAEMRRIRGLASRRAAPDWRAVQKSFDDRFGASLYLLAVLTDDLYATSAHVWLWSPAPWPATPTTRTLSLESGDQAFEPLVTAFGAPAVPAYVRLGARFVDAEGPVASSVIQGGPALAAGLAPGDRVREISGQPVSTVRELTDGARRLVGQEALLRTGSETVSTDVRLTVEELPGVISLADATVIDQVVAARLALALLDTRSEIPRWLLQLNQAAIYLRAMSYRAAVPLLRTIQAPEGAGLSRAMVDYWLASTLLSLDTRGYADAARAALERALAAEGARLYHADGPLLAPRARARLGALDRLLGR